MESLKILQKIANALDKQGMFKEADHVDNLLKKLAKKKKEKWMQKAVKRPGALHKALGYKEGETIPTSVLEKKKKTLQRKAEGDKILSDSDARLLKQIIFALNARK